MKRLAPLFAIFLSLALIVSVVGTRPVNADVPFIQTLLNVAATGNVGTTALTGQSTCSVVVAGTWSGTLLVQTSNDFPRTNPGTWSTDSDFGSITGNGTYGPHSVGASGLSGIRIGATIAAGTAVVTETCSGAIIPGSGGGGTTPTFSPFPNPANVVVCPSSEPATAPIGGLYTCTISSTGKLNVDIPVPTVTLPVTTPPPAPTTPIPSASIGVVPFASGQPVVAAEACMVPAGATPNVTGGNLIAVQCGTNGALNANIVNTVPIPQSTPSGLPLPIASAGAAQPGAAPFLITFPGCSRVGTISMAQDQFHTLVCTSTASLVTASIICASAGLNTQSNCVVPGPAPTASAGAVPQTTAVPVNAQDACTYNTGAISVTNTNAIAMQCDINGNLKVNIASQPTPLPVASTFATAVATTGPLVVTAASTIIYSGAWTNSGAVTYYCALYNVAAASVTPGTTQPLIIRAVPSGQSVPFFTPPSQGLTFGTAVSHFCATTKDGATSATSGDVWIDAMFR